MIDDQIRNALKVEPSPEFLARVRTRIANERAPSAWRRSWTVAAAGAMAAAIVIAVVVSRPVPPIDRQPGPLTPGSIASSTPAPASTSVAQAFRPAIAGRSAKAFARRASAEPEILIDPAETRALRGLMTGVRDGRVNLEAVQNSVAPQPMTLEPVGDIVIAPLTIEPIAPRSGAEGERP